MIQPTWRLNDPTWNLSQYIDENDPLGWGYSFSESTSWSLYISVLEVIDLIPDDNINMPHSVVTGCKLPSTIPQPYAVSFNPNWRVIASTSVVYEGGTPASTSATTTTPTQPPPNTQATSQTQYPSNTPNTSPTQSLRYSPIVSLTEPLPNTSAASQTKSSSKPEATNPATSSPDRQAVNSDQSPLSAASPIKPSPSISPSTDGSGQSSLSDTQVAYSDPTLSSPSTTSLDSPSETPNQDTSVEKSATRAVEGTKSATRDATSPIRSVVATSRGNTAAVWSLWGVLLVLSPAALLLAM